MAGLDFTAVTELRAVPLCPEIRLHLAALWQGFDAFREQNQDKLDAEPPYWAVTWPGGQALARYILDRHAVVAGKIVLDLGAGCGIAAIAAAMAKGSVVAIDRQPMAIEAIRRNSAANGAVVDARIGDFEAELDVPPTVVLAGDLWYEPDVAQRATRRLRRLANSGALVLIGDPDRSYRPRHDVTQLARYAIEADPRLETSACVIVTVGHLLG